jgi:hypothetical protein
MRKQIVATVSAAALSVALGLAAAHAQTPESGPQGAAPTAPAAQPSSPGGGNSPGGMTQRGEDAGPSAGAPDRQTGEKIGERTKEPGTTTDRDRKAAGADRQPTSKSAEREGRDDRDARDRNRKSAESKEEIDRKSAKTEDKESIDHDRNSVETRDSDRMDRGSKSAETGDRDRMDRDRKGATVKIDADQKQKVRTYFSEHRPAAKRVDKSRVSVSIGAPLPTGIGITLAPLPPDIVVVAADCPLQYFLWGEDIVLVDSCSREVVDIIPNLG